MKDGITGIRLLAVLLLAFAIETHAGAELVGAPFSDPGYRAPVPAGWVQRPISYEPWAGDADLAVTLDQHLYHALLPAVRAFAARERVDIAIREGTCGISAGKLTDRSVDMGGFCCPPAPEDRLPGLRFITLGIGSLALLVNTANPVADLSRAQAQAIFAGEIQRWQDVGDGVPGFIRPVGRLHCKQRPGHWRLLLDHENLFSPRLIEVSSIADMIATVAGDPQAIGHEVLWMVEREKAWRHVRAVAIDGVSPADPERLAAGHYPFYRTFNITLWERPHASAAATALAAHLQRAAERLDPKYGIVPAARLREHGWRFAGDELVGEPQ